jgi:hypothetical protein
MADPSGPLTALLLRCHEALRGSRGAVLSLASLSSQHSRLEWLGVGNVEALLLTPHSDPRATNASLVVRPGVVGSDLPVLRPATLPIVLGDTLVFATDGVDRAFAERLARNLPVQELADGILARHGRRSDDALVLVVRYCGPGADAPPAEEGEEQ